MPSGLILSEGKASTYTTSRERVGNVLRCIYTSRALFANIRKCLQTFSNVQEHSQTCMKASAHTA